MNWAKCAAAGIKFAFIRSTIGASGLDNRFAENWAGAEAAGLLRGAYHLFRPDRDAIAQAEHFVATAAKLGELPPAVDLEHVPGAAIQPSYPEEVRLFLELRLAGTGRKPIIYTSPSFWQNPLGAPAWGSEYDLWQAQWTSAETPDEMAPWDGDWTFWQWTNEGLGTDYGAASTYIDLNHFNGDEAALLAYAEASRPTPPDQTKRVRLTGDANVRSEPRLAAETLIGQGTTPAGREFTLLGFVPGQDVGGNDQWAQVVALVHSSLVQAVDGPTPEPGDGFDSPVGTAAERATPQIWPGKWVDANPFLNLYEIRPGVFHYHTGADLNLNYPSWDADRFKPVYAVSDGTVTHARELGGSWGNVVVVRHELADGCQVYSRSAHLDTMTVVAGQDLLRGEQLGTIGRPPPDGAYHLHFDIAISDVLESDPGHWPGTDAQAVIDNYTDPRQFIIDNRRPLPPILPQPPDKVDLLPYFTGNITGNSVPFELQTSWGPQERVQLQVEGDTFYYVKGNPTAANWEERWIDPDGGMIYFGTDTSESEERYYTQRMGAQYGAPWCPRHLEVGEVAGPFTPHVTHYRKNDCVVVQAGGSVDYRKLLAVHASYTFPSNITLDGVIELAWLRDPAGPWLEKYWLSRDQRAPGLVGWQSSDGRHSWVSELHTPGSRPDSIRLHIPCLQRS
jgi:GH25 family lysozyme M1 (1,4-beta-N-acetylmuramidase)